MRYEVLLTEEAERDLEAILRYLAEFDSPASAGNVLDQLLETAETLATFPERGSHLKELLVLGIRDYRQIFFNLNPVVGRGEVCGFWGTWLRCNSLEWNNHSASLRLALHPKNCAIHPVAGLTQKVGVK